MTRHTISFCKLFYSSLDDARRGLTAVGIARRLPNFETDIAYVFVEKDAASFQPRSFHVERHMEGVFSLFGELHEGDQVRT